MRRALTSGRVLALAQRWLNEWSAAVRDTTDMETQTQPRRLLVTAAEAAQLLGCSVLTVKRLAEKGDLRAVRLAPSGHLRFRLRDVEQFVAEKEDER